MGKKKIAEQTENKTKTAATEVAKDQSSEKTQSAGTRKIETGRLYIKASYNNTFVTMTDEKGNTLAWASAGSLGFSGPKKATPFAASKIIATIAERVSKTGPFNIHVFVMGVGSGRDTAVRSLPNHGFSILSIRDVTPVPHNGSKSKKVRRV